MGQAESGITVSEKDKSNPLSSSSPSKENPEHASLDSLIAEAAAYGDENDDDQSLEAKAQRALECPCVAPLLKGPCGSQFSDAFVCFLKSTAEEKGSDCVRPFVALQNCIKSNPGAFSSDVLEDDEEKKKENK